MWKDKAVRMGRKQAIFIFDGKPAGRLSDSKEKKPALAAEGIAFMTNATYNCSKCKEKDENQERERGGGASRKGSAS